MNYPHLQLNSPYRRRWLSFDLDRSDAATAHEAAGVAAPNWIVINPANGHAHADYELAAPVTYYAKSRWTSINYLADIQHGMTTRLDADMGYSGHLTKNPFHENWITIPLRETPYSLGELASYLTKDERRRRTRKRKGEAEMCGLRRNCSLFDWVRLEIAYPHVIRFKRDGASFRDFLNFVFNAALDKNRSEFSGNPLTIGDVSGIARSVAKWTWKRFSPDAFSELQRARGIRGMAKRWAGHTPLHESKPWEAENIGRATWYRRQKMKGQAQGETITISG
jgi:hypothetical protein